MLAIATETSEAFAAKGRKKRYIVSYKRRYWDVDTQAFLLEAAYTELERAEVRGIGASRENLDREGVNEFKASNVTIEINDDLKQWTPQAPIGLLAADSIAKIGYERQLMEFRVQIAVEHEDGTESSPIDIFIGRAVVWDEFPAMKTIAVTLESSSILLERSNAEDISTARSDTALAFVSGVIWETTDNGVGRITEIRDNTGVLRAGADYTVSQLNEPSLAARVTFATAPAGTPTADYIFWKTDEKIDDLVKDILANAGISDTSGVDAVLYQNRVLFTNVQTSEADWNAGTQSQTRTDSFPGDVVLDGIRVFDDFEDGSFEDGNPRTWTRHAFGGPNDMFVSGGIVNFANSNNQAIMTPSTQNSGTWQTVCGMTGAGTIVYFLFHWDSTAFPGSGSGGSGYAIQFDPADNGWRLFRFDAGSAVLLAFLETRSPGQTLIRITRDGANQFKVYVFGTLRATVTDGTYTSSSYIGLSAVGGPGSAAQWTGVDTSATVFAPPAAYFASGTQETQAIDAGEDFIQWLKVQPGETEPIGTSITYETAVADESFPGSGVPGAFDAYVSLGPTLNIKSANKRFLKIRATLNATADQSVTPTLGSLTATAHLSTTRIRLANFTGKTGLSAVQELAAIANYQFGFTRSGVFFFQARDFDEVVDFTIQIQDLQAFARITDGVDRVYNEILASYGTSERLVNPTTQLDCPPTSADKFGIKRLNIGAGGTGILINPDADVATGLAVSYFEQFKNPRRRFELEIDLAPQLELSDTILMQIADQVPNPPWHVGDSSRAVGDTDIHLYGIEQQSAYDIKARVLAVTHEIGTEKTRLELEEIL